ncbi:MAG: hypothetical protein JO108_20430 [Acidobacteriaceae bacterium]|nr:hypothetical protein [Acidobacteriaceae bacterium]
MGFVTSPATTLQVVACHVGLAHIDEVTADGGGHIAVHGSQWPAPLFRAVAVEEVADDLVLREDGIEDLSRSEGVFLPLTISQCGCQILHHPGVNPMGKLHSKGDPGALISIQAGQTHDPQRPPGDL